MLLYSSIILFGVAAFIVAKNYLSAEERFKASESLQEAEATTKKTNLGIIFQYSKPIVKRYFSGVVSGMKSKAEIKNKYKRKLASAGLTQEMSPEEFFSYKLFLILGFPILFLGLRSFLEADWPLVAVPAVSLVGYFYPDIWLNGRVDQRKKDIIMNMPFIVDMLALSVEAGLDFLAAMVKVVEKAPPSALSEEFQTLVKEIKIGAPRAEALRNLSWRADVLPIASFCATLIAADQVGASIGPILKTLSNEIRQKRSTEIEKAGATAATKMLFPMLMFIMPAVLIIIGAPFALEMIGANK